MTWADLAGHLAYVFLFIGQMMIADGDRQGWQLRFVGEVVWIGIGAYIGLSSVVIWGLIFLGVDLYGALRK